jgi:lysophospholipase L1-like esterase/dienelactone hydrolase
MRLIPFIVLILSTVAVAHPPAYPLEAAHLDQPFWNGGTVWGEAVLFVTKDGSRADGTLLLKPAKILRVKNSRSGEVYEEGKDFQVDAEHRKLVLTEGSRVPFMRESELYTKAGMPGSLDPKVGDPTLGLLWAEYGFAAKQVEVDYEPAEKWDGITPRGRGAMIPRTLAKLRKKEPVQIVVSGDSISAGGNASLYHNDPPYQPAFPELVREALEKRFGSEVKLLNLAVGGYQSQQAMIALDKVIAAKPDLVIVAYGMNDVGLRDPALYSNNIQRFMDAVRAKVPEVEFVLVSTSLGNPEWGRIPSDQFPKYREALACLRGPVEHTSFADVTELWKEIMRRKRYLDLTGNGLNHPNDFGHRLYAESLLALFDGPAELVDLPAKDRQRVDIYTDHAGEVHPVKTAKNWQRRRAEILCGMQEAMGRLPDRSHLPKPQVKILSTEKKDGYEETSLLLKIERDGDDVPALLLVPDHAPGAKLPAMLALHETINTGKGAVAEPGSGYDKYGYELVKRGYVVICPDYPSFGDYKIDFKKFYANGKYLSCTMKGIYNHMRCVDLLVSRDDVDPERIGVIGHSLGGHNSMFVAAFDERLKAVVASCGWTPFASYYGGNIKGWTSDRYMPRLRDVYKLEAERVPFDFSGVIAALAPRAFFSNSPLRDANFDVKGVKKGIELVKPVYELLGGADALKVVHPDCEHSFPDAQREEAYEFLDGVLKK